MGPVDVVIANGAAHMKVQKQRCPLCGLRRLLKLKSESKPIVIFDTECKVLACQAHVYSCRNSESHFPIVSGVPFLIIYLFIFWHKRKVNSIARRTEAEDAVSYNEFLHLLSQKKIHRHVVPLALPVWTRTKTKFGSL